MWTALVSALVSLIGSGIGYAQTNAAQDEARGLNDQNIRLNAQQNRFNNNMLSRQQDLQEDRFQLDTEKAGYDFANDAVKRLEGMLNTNVGLQDIVLKKWGV